MQKDQLETDLKMRKRMDLFEKTKTHLMKPLEIQAYLSYSINFSR